MKPDDIRRLFPNASASCIAANLEPDRPAPRAEPQRPVLHEPVAEVRRAEGDPPRLRVRITSRRVRLIDPDNLTGKYFVDCLVRRGIIAGDSAKHVEYSIRQEKADRDETVIEIFES